MRIHTFVFHRISNPKITEIGGVLLLQLAFKIFTSKKNLTGVSFFSSHTLAWVIFWLFILFISVVCLITHLFPHRFLWNLYHTFTYVYSTSIPNLSFTLESLKGSEYTLHCMLKDAITCLQIKWNFIFINYIDMLVFDSSLKKMWRLEFPGETY